MWSRSWTHFRVDRRSAEQVIVAAHAYGSSKLLHHMQHKGRLTGLSDALGQRARTNSEQLLVVTRPHEEWKRDPEKIHIVPESVAITSGVWPDEVTSIEPVYYGVGSSMVALLTPWDGNEYTPDTETRWTMCYAKPNAARL
jgi:cholesterol oxidase